MSGTAAVVQCEDGTEIPFEWIYAGAEAFEWQRDDEHWTRPLTPMESWLREHGFAGTDRAWDEAGLEAPPMFRRFQLAGPFLYARESPDEPERMARMVEGMRRVVREHGGALAFWQKYCVPHLERTRAELASMDGGSSLQGAAELWAYGFHQTFTSLVVLFEPSMRLGALLAESFGVGAELLGHEVTQGGENATRSIDGEIWALTEIARRTPAVRRALEGAAEGETLAALRREPAAEEFLAAFEALIARHGTRSEGWDLGLPTWGERPEGPLSLVRSQLAAEGVSPAEVAARSEARRREATERALAALPAEKHRDFNKSISMLEGYVGIREDRAYWQMVLSGEVRGLLLRHGAALVERGRIDRADDMLMLTPDDVDGGPADLRPLVIDRRRAWERWCSVVPPAKIGTPGAAVATPAAAPARDELRGSAASRGVVTGPARVLRDPSDTGRLRPGDVLVCVATTPAWTPLFAIVAGIITETGGALSHPAITAREYGIPAVVAVKGATTRIRDGQMITVDGGAGTVVLGE